SMSMSKSKNRTPEHLNWASVNRLQAGPARFSCSCPSASDLERHTPILPNPLDVNEQLAAARVLQGVDDPHGTQATRDVTQVAQRLIGGQTGGGVNRAREQNSGIDEVHERAVLIDQTFENLNGRRPLREIIGGISQLDQPSGSHQVTVGLLAHDTWDLHRS